MGVWPTIIIGLKCLILQIMSREVENSQLQNVEEFINSLERTELDDEQQTILLVGGSGATRGTNQCTNFFCT